MKVQEKEILFTSGGTESDNIALIGGAYANCRAGRHIITTRIEHPAVLQTCAYLEEQGFAVTYLPVDVNGVIRLADLEKAMTRNTILVSIMHTNNEVGSVQPIEQAGELIRRMNPNTLFHGCIRDTASRYLKGKSVSQSNHPKGSLTLPTENTKTR